MNTLAAPGYEEYCWFVPRISPLKTTENRLASVFINTFSQVMAVIIDDDPASSNNQSGLFGIEIESITKLYVKNIGVKKLN